MDTENDEFDWELPEEDGEDYTEERHISQWLQTTNF